MGRKDLAVRRNCIDMRFACKGVGRVIGWAAIASSISFLSNQSSFGQSARELRRPVALRESAETRIEAAALVAINGLVQALSQGDTSAVSSVLTLERIPPDERGAAMALGCTSPGHLIAEVRARQRRGSPLAIESWTDSVQVDVGNNGAVSARAVLFIGHSRGIQRAPIRMRFSLGVGGELRTERVEGLLAILCEAKRAR